MLIKLIVVDDESTTRKGIIKHINWNQLGVDVIEEARNGIDALEIAEEIHPDIVISDIRMPGLNGIEFAIKLREKFKNCKIIFLSGYSDKEYLRAAIKLGAVSYVEKPINLTEIREAIQKAVELCREEELNMTLTDNIDLIKQRLVQNLIHNSAKIEQCYKLLSLIKSNLPMKKWFYVVIIKIIKPREEYSTDDIINTDEFMKIVDKSLGNIEYIAAFKDNRTLRIIISDDKAVQNTIENLLELLEKYIEEREISDNKLFCTVGKKVFEIEQLPKSYISAKESVKKLFFYGYGRVVYSKEEVKRVYKVRENIHDEFLKYIDEENEEGAKCFIKRLFLDIKQFEGTDINDIKNIFFKIATNLIAEAEKRGVYFSDEEKSENEQLWNLIFNFNTLEEVQEYIENKISKVFRKFEDSQNSCRAVFEVKKLIRRDFGDEKLSVKSLADAVFLTPTYLSALFKKETGKNISECIVEVRLEKSKEYLRNSKLKLFEVAKLVGYNDSNYYAKAFKKVEGITPSEYREKYSS